jgi:hypothetical protein
MTDEEYPCDPGYCQNVELHASIKALTAENKRLGQQCEGLMKAGMNNGQALILAEAKLATCEKYRDAYDRMGRIGTEAYRDLEVKLAKAVEGLRDAVDAWDNHNKTGDMMQGHWVTNARTTLAELTGGKDD